MTEQNAQATETSNPAPQPAKPKGNQLEGTKAQAISTKDAAAMFKGTMIGDTAPSDKSSEDKADNPKAKTNPKNAKKPKGQSKQDADNTNSEAEEAELEDDEDIEGDVFDDEDEEGQSDEDEADEVEDGAEDDAFDEDEETDADDEDLHTVIVDGEELQIPYEELVSGYQRQADYTRKSTELAEQRKALKAQEEQVADLPKVKEAYEQQATRFNQNAQLVLTAFEKGFMPEPPSEELRASNPAEYLLQKEKHQEALQFVNGLQHEMHNIQQKQLEEHQKLVDQGRVKLMEAQPELKDPDTRGKFQKYIMDMGYTQEQIKGEADHRLFELAYKAMKWDQMVERSKQKPAPEKKRPKVMKQRKAREDRQSIAQKRKSEAQNRHKTDRSMKSASALISQRIQSANKR